MTEQQPEADPTPDQSEGSRESDQSDQPGDSRQEQLDSGEPGDIGDDQLPEDLQPTEDNPLARHPGQTGDEEDEIGADREDDPDTAPLTEADADYGSGDHDAS